jgi:tol-pal system protein YbgF
MELAGGKSPLAPLIKGGARAASRGISVVAFLLPLAVHAALFDDNEARRQIGDMKSRIESHQKAIEERLSGIESASRNRAVDLTQLMDALKQDLAKLRGQVEVLLNHADQIERRQKDLYVDLDTRLRKLEQAQSKLDQAQSQIQEKLSKGDRDAAAEKQAYESALNQFKVGNYQLAISGFQSFIGGFPNSQLAPNAQYWIGNSHSQMRDYKSAIAAQQKVIGSWPDNPKAPDAMLDIASYQAEMGDSKAARETLGVLLKKYPASPAAEKAKQRLAHK